MKDYFSAGSANYAKFRPDYPRELFDFLAELAPSRQRAWDCATGNGQVAKELSGYFEKVFATDISAEQIKNAPPVANVEYSLQPAEASHFPDSYFDLITVAQAIHWFDFDKFYAEVKRTLKPGGVLAVIGYDSLQIDPALDDIIENLYYNIVGPFWYPERNYVEEKYQTIPFPFRELDAPVFYKSFDWSFKQLIGYLETWSAVRNFKNHRGSNPVDLVLADLQRSWNNRETTRVIFPTLLRVGTVD